MLELLVIDQKADSIIRAISFLQHVVHIENFNPCLPNVGGDGDIYTVDKLKFEEIKASTEVFKKRMSAAATRCNDLNFALASRMFAEIAKTTAETIERFTMPRISIIPTLEKFREIEIVKPLEVVVQEGEKVAKKEKDEDLPVGFDDVVSGIDDED